MANTTVGLRKLGAVVYLKSFATIPVEGVISNLRLQWPEASGQVEGQENRVAHLKIGMSHVAIELRRKCVPDSLTDAVLASTLHWHSAKKDIAAHTAHIAVAASIDDGDTLVLASDLTKVVATLLEMTDSVCVCWLNGPVLTLREDFVSNANDLLRIGQPPFFLWVGVNWSADSGLIHTKGMAQFGAPEIFIGKQSAASEQMLMYLQNLIRDLLMTKTDLIVGHTIEGPNCVFKVESLGSGNPNRGLLLLPFGVN
jgi:hypothetical protein